MINETIPGVFNYCNRWCERCPLGHRCTVYITERQMEQFSAGVETEAAADESLDQENEGPEVDFQLEGPENDAQEIAFVPDDFHFEEPSAEELEASRLRREKIREQQSNHPAMKLAAETGECAELVVGRWLHIAEKRTAPGLEGLSHKQQQKLEGEEHRLQNFIDILKWYRYFLEAKTGRAVMGKLEDGEDVEDPVQNDWNGSAKVVLVGIGHCEKAAQGLLELVPPLEDELLLLLTALKNYSLAMRKSFPRAMEFIRPGFDTLGISENLGS